MAGIDGTAIDLAPVSPSAGAAAPFAEQRPPLYAFAVDDHTDAVLR
jgi:hypothetical protein